MSRCRCHSRRQEKRCCGPYHQGRAAPTPEALMRSRFAAYARGLTDYIIATTDPDGPMWEDDATSWRAQIDAFCRDTVFSGLLVDDAPAPHAQEGFVEFTARLVRDGVDVSFTERSRFTRRGGHWRYHSGERVS